MADRTVSVKLTADIAEYVAKLKAAGKSTRDLEQANRDLQAANDAAEDAAGRARVSEAKLDQTRKSSNASVSQLAAAEEEHSSNLRKLDSALSKATDAEGRFQEAVRRSNDEQDKSGKKTEETISRVASRANAAFDVKTFGGLSLGLPAAAAIGAAGAGIAIAGIATAFAGLGVYIASQDEQIAKHFTETMNGIERDAKGMGAAFKGEVSGAIDDMAAAWDRLKPAVAAAVDASAPAVRILTGAVTDFAENAMPGMVDAVLASGPPLEGLRSLAAQTGTGMSQFFTNVSAGSVSAGAGLASLGGTVQLLLSRLGTLFSNLANASGGPLSSLHVVIDEVTSALNAMTAGGSGVLGFMTGFTNAGTGAVTAISTLARLVSLLPPQLTEVAGSLTAANLLASKFGIQAGAGFEGLGAKIGGATGSIGKISAALEGLSLGAINPAFLAVGLLGIGLDALGKKQAAAAAAAAAHAKNVEDLTQALRADNGVLGANTAATVAKALQDKNAASNSQAFGISLGKATAAATGHKAAMDDVTTSSSQYIETIGRQAGLSQQAITGLQGINKSLLENGGSYDSVKGQASGFLSLLSNGMTEYQNGLIGAGGQTVKMTAAQAGLLQQIFNGTGAIGEQAKATREAQQTQQDYNNAISGTAATMADSFGAMTAGRSAAIGLSTDFAKLSGAGNDVVEAGHAIIDVLRILSGQTPSVDEAMQAWNDTIRGLKDSFKGLDLKGQSKDLIDSSGAINTVSEAGSKLQDTVTGAADKFASYGKSLKDAGVPADEIVTKLAAMRTEFGNQLKAAGLTDKQVKTLLDHYGLMPDKVVTQLGLEGNAEAQDQISNLIASLDSVPANKGVKVDVLSDAARAALIQLGYQVVQLPDGTFQVFANTEAGRQGVADFKKTIDNTYGIAHVKATDGEAQGTITAWQQRADGTTGWTTLDTRVDPATGRIQYWTRQANGAYAWSTLDTRIDPATGKVQGWVRMADGTWAFANLNANTAAAEAAINNAARTRHASIVVTYDVRGAPRLPAGANRADFAVGGVAKPMANGGVLGMAGGGGLRPMSPIAQRVPPNTWRIVGDNLRHNEYFIPANGSARSRAILQQAMADPALQSQVTSGRAWVGSMAPKVVIPMQSSSSQGLPPEAVAAFAAQIQAAVVAGLSQASFNLDSRGVSTLGTKGAALNSVR